MLAERINDDDDDDVCQQVLALALFISACQLDSRFGWVDFVSFTGLLQAAAFFTVHILNRFPDVLNAFVIVSLMPWFHAQFIAFFACNYCNLSVVMENIHGCSVSPREYFFITLESLHCARKNCSALRAVNRTRHHGIPTLFFQRESTRDHGQRVE